MANNSNDSPREITRLVIGLLFGSGITGAAISMIQGSPDVRPWAMSIFVLSLAAAGAVYWWGEQTIARQDKKGLAKLSAAYGRILNVLGQYVSGWSDKRPISLFELAAKMDEEVNRPTGEGDEVDWVKEFKNGSKNTIESWRKQSVTRATEAKVPEGAVPQMEDEGIPLEDTPQ